MISGCHVVLRHVRGDDLGSQCPIEGLQVPEYPLCASCSECGVIALLARVHVGPCVVHPATPTLGALPNPPVYCLPDPSYHHPAAPHPSPRPTPKPHSPTHIFPQNSSTHYHQPSVPHSKGTLVKSNPIIRRSAVQEKKENFPLVNSRFPFSFSSPFFSPQVEAR